MLASEQDRRRPVINVVAWIFVDPQGDVTAAQVISNEGGDVFAQASPGGDPAMEAGVAGAKSRKGGQLVLTWRFRGPNVSDRRR